MEFATLAAFLVVATALCLGDRGIRAHLARRGGEAGPNPQRPTYALATAIKLLGRRPDRGPFRHGAPEFLEFLVGGLPVLAPLLALATVPFGRDLQVIRSSAGVLAWIATADAGRDTEGVILRRLQLAAEDQGCWVVLFRPAGARLARSPAALRIRVSQAAATTRVEILKCRGGRPNVVDVASSTLDGPAPARAPYA